MGALPRYIRLAIAIFLTPLGTLGFYSRTPTAYAIGGVLVLALCAAVIAVVRMSGLPLDLSVLSEALSWLAPSMLPDEGDYTIPWSAEPLQSRIGSLILVTILVGVVFTYLAGVAFGKAWRSHLPRRAIGFSIAGTALALLPIMVGLAANADVRSRIQQQSAHADIVSKVMAAADSVRRSDAAPDEMRSYLTGFMVGVVMKGEKDFRGYVAQRTAARATPNP